MYAPALLLQSFAHTSCCFAVLSLMLAAAVTVKTISHMCNFGVKNVIVYSTYLLAGYNRVLMHKTCSYSGQSSKAAFHRAVIVGNGLHFGNLTVKI